jgi:DNA primase
MIARTQIARARQVDLLRLVEPDTTLIRIANTHGGEYAGPCPFCGGADRFHVVPELGRWYCRQCTPRGGDAIDYLQRREQLAFQEAVAYLAGHTTGLVGMRTRVRPTARQASLRNWMQPAWQQAAHALVREAEAALADEATGAAARAYLAQRGLSPASWETWRMGCSLAWQPVRREALPAITLPWFGADGAPQAVQYRYFGPGIAKHERFGQKAGGQRLLFGLPLSAGRPTLIIIEGELNAISCWQVAQSWADVLSIGSQENARPAAVVEALMHAALPYRQVIVWLDERERALALGDRIAPFNGTAVWSEDDLDANDLLQRGLLTARLGNVLADVGWEQA